MPRLTPNSRRRDGCGKAICKPGGCRDQTSLSLAGGEVKLSTTNRQLPVEESGQTLHQPCCQRPQANDSTTPSRKGGILAQGSLKGKDQVLPLVAGPLEKPIDVERWKPPAGRVAGPSSHSGLQILTAANTVCHGVLRGSGRAFRALRFLNDHQSNI